MRPMTPCIHVFEFNKIRAREARGSQERKRVSLYVFPEHRYKFHFLKSFLLSLYKKICNNNNKNNALACVCTD